MSWVYAFWLLAKTVRNLQSYAHAYSVSHKKYTHVTPVPVSIDYTANLTSADRGGLRGNTGSWFCDDREVLVLGIGWNLI